MNLEDQLKALVYFHLEEHTRILAGIITYLLLAIYCHGQHNEKVNIKRVRELRIKIRNEIYNNGGVLLNAK
ncbi:hypothetical protein KA005_37645 [bacterium]|nr:hypothetical protein [bacterium]